MSESEFYALKKLIRNAGFSGVFSAISEIASEYEHEERQRDGGANPYFLAAFVAAKKSSDEFVQRHGDEV